jgi:hypothetical protein
MVAAEDEGEGDVVLQIRQKDQSAITTQVFFGEKCVADVVLQESNDVQDLSRVDRSSWMVRNAGGVDPAVVSCRVLDMERLRLIQYADFGCGTVSSGDASYVETVGWSRYC